MKKQKNTNCPEYGTKLEEYCGNYFCSNCNRTYMEIVDDDGNAIFEPATSEYEEQAIPKEVSKTKLTAIIACVFVVLVFAVYWIFGDRLFDNKITKVLKENNYLSTEYDVVSTVKNGDGETAINGLNDDSGIVLLKHHLTEQSEYIICEVDTVNGQVGEISFKGYKPLEIILSYIMKTKCDENENTDNFNRIINYMEEYGIYCLDFEEYAKLYYNEITGKNGLISVKEAQQLIKDSSSQLISSDNEILSSEIVFDDNSAKPAYYCVQTVEEVYSFVIPEKSYSAWYAGVDKKTRDLTFAIYGSPYKSKKMWNLYDESNKKLGSFEDKNDMYKYIESQKLKTHAKEKMSGSSSEKTLNVAIDYSIYLSAETDLMTLIASRLNYNIKYNTFSDYKVVVNAFKNNTCDVCIHRSEKKTYLNIDHWKQECSFSTEYFDDYVMLVDKDKPELLEELNSAITELKKDGTVATIFEGYGKNVSYCVRKSFSDRTYPENVVSSRFVRVDDAKKYADKYKSEGYKVFDSYGNCVYNP